MGGMWPGTFMQLILKASGRELVRAALLRMTGQNKSLAHPTAALQARVHKPAGWFEAQACRLQRVSPVPGPHLLLRRASACRAVPSAV